MTTLTTVATPQRALKTKALRILDDLPPFSPIMNRLLASLAGEDVSFIKLGELIEKDTVIAGNLLHIVNSALYARRTTVNSVRHALSVLGMAKLRNIVLGMSVANMWNRTKVPAGWSMKRFDMHSAAVAILSDLLAQRLRVSYPEGAFIAGLFHDLGRLLIALGLPQDVAAISTIVERTARPLSECEKEILGFTHAELSAEATAVWKLPLPVQAAVGSHHDSWAEGNGSGEIALGRIVSAANHYVNSTGNSISPGAGTVDSDAKKIEKLGLDRDRLEKLLDEFCAEYSAMLQFFS